MTAPERILLNWKQADYDNTAFINDGKPEPEETAYTRDDIIQALIAEARREGTKLLLDAYKGMLVLRRILYKAGLVEGGSAADQIAKRIVDAHPEFPGLASLRALKETTHD